jgi:hypothetical protein
VFVFPIYSLHGNDGVAGYRSIATSKTNMRIDMTCSATEQDLFKYADDDGGDFEVCLWEERYNDSSPQRWPLRVSTAGPMCPRHMRALMHVDIRASDISGYGLFAHGGLNPSMLDGEIPVFNRGDHLFDYTGESLTLEEFNKRYPGENTVAEYVLKGGPRKSELIIDASKMPQHACAFVNHSDNDYFTNAEFRYSRRRRAFPVKVVRAIYHGQEILINYGRDFWASSSRKKKKKQQRDEKEDKEEEDCAHDGCIKRRKDEFAKLQSRLNAII